MTIKPRTQKQVNRMVKLLIILASILARSCSSGYGDVNSLGAQFDFKSVTDFSNFIQIFKLKSTDDLLKEGAPVSYINDRAAILGLERVIASEEVCASHKINELVDYHKKYFASSYMFRSKPITQEFFKKYAIQVAHICKLNLIKNLTKAREELAQNSRVFEEAKEKVFSVEHGLKSNLKLLQNQPNEPATVNLKPRNDFELTLSEYREALVKLVRPEDILTFDSDECETSRRRYMKISFDKLQTFLEPALMCHQLHRYYAGSILSIARLANIGYMALDEILDKRLSENPMLRDWILAAQVCDSMLHLCTKELSGDWAIVDYCVPTVPIIELVVYDDSLEAFDEDLLKEMIPKSEASRAGAQKLMKSAFKTMAKADLMKQLKSGAGIKGIFKKSLSLFAHQETENAAATAQARAELQSTAKFSVQFSRDAIPINLEETNEDKLCFYQPKSDQESYETLMNSLGVERNEKTAAKEQRNNGIDSAVSVFDPMTSLVSFFTVIAIMMSFEWLFFVVMTLAARICHHMYFNFDDLLTFPPKILSWSDADFARLSDKMEKIDQDDYYDFDELSPDERQQRDLLRRVFGKPPPMLYRE